MIDIDEIFVRYPQLNSLRSLVSDEVIKSEIGSRVSEFEKWLAEAKKLIPMVNLNQVFPADLERGSIRLENFLGHWGNVSIEEVCKICLIVRWLRPKRILELGTYNGMTTLQMALNAPRECTTYTLDLPDYEKNSLPMSKIDKLVATFFLDNFNNVVGRYFARRADLNIRQLFGNSTRFDYSMIDVPVDLVFVDAAHDYESKCQDSDTAFRLLARPGAILWHNYGDVTCPYVTRCLAEYAQHYKIWHLRNTYLAVYFSEWI